MHVLVIEVSGRRWGGRTRYKQVLYKNATIKVSTAGVLCILRGTAQVAAYSEGTWRVATLVNAVPKSSDVEVRGY